jgi:hypothetical protein
LEAFAKLKIIREIIYKLDKLIAAEICDRGAQVKGRLTFCKRVVQAVTKIGTNKIGTQRAHERLNPMEMLAIRNARSRMKMPKVLKEIGK